MVAGTGMSKPLTVEQRLERLEAVTIPPIPENLCGRLEDLERMGRRLSDEGAEIRTRTTELERGWRWASDKLAEQESAFGSLETKIATLDSFRIGHSASMGKLSDRLRNLEEFRGRFDEDLVALTRRIAAAEEPDAQVATLAIQVKRLDDFGVGLGDRVGRVEQRAHVLEGFPVRILDLERARDLVLSRLEELGAWTTPARALETLEETLRNEAAQLTGRASSANSDAPFDGAAAEALYHVGSALATAALGLMAALKDAAPREAR